MADDLLTNVWPDWIIEGKPIGRGSYGAVYKAVKNDAYITSYSAIKIIHIPGNDAEIDSLRAEGLTTDQIRDYLRDIVDDFVDEIKIMDRFKGVQNIVSVEDYKVVEKSDEIGWTIFIRMELLKTFIEYSSEVTITEDIVTKLGVDICSALELCEKRNVIHRDIKPENIFVNEYGDFKLGDFGVARKLENITGGLSQKGTPYYMAPEIYRAENYDSRVDTYSLGLLLYRLLNRNKLPFFNIDQQVLRHDEKETAVRRRLNGEALPPPCDASPAMQQVILKACAYDPANRYLSPADMKRALIGVSSAVKPVAALLDLSSVDLDKTTSVRRVQPAPPQRVEQQVVHEFGERKKSNKKWIIIGASVITGLLLITGVVLFLVFFGPLKGNKDKNNGNVYSNYDIEKINSVLSDAEAMAGNENYEGALTKVKTALVSYPKSEELKEKESKYEDLLSKQIRDKYLDEAANKADAGEYPVAIGILKDAQENDNDHYNDYQAKIDSYSKTYKDQTIESADQLAAIGNYADALQMVNVAIDVIGDDPDLQDRKEAYEDEVPYIPEQTQQTQETQQTQQTQQTTELTQPQPAVATPVTISGKDKTVKKKVTVEASHALTQKDGQYQSAAKAFDGNVKTAWNVNQHQGVGEHLDFYFPAGTRLDSIKIIPGFCNNGNNILRFKRNFVPTNVTISYGGMVYYIDMNSCVGNINRAKKGYSCSLDGLVITDPTIPVMITIDSSRNYNKEHGGKLNGKKNTDYWNDCCISEVTFKGILG